MKLTLRRDLGGYALDVVQRAGIDGTALDRPFTLLTGPNGSGKSAIMRAIRATIGLRGERGGQTDCEFGDRSLGIEDVDGDVERLTTHVEHFREAGPAKHVPAVFSLADLGWKGQPTYYFDSREASSISKKSSFDEDIGYHISMIAGGGSQVSHGQFVAKTWWEALGWAAGLQDVEGGWSRGTSSPARKALLDAALGGGDPSTERWLFIDEPETAIDSEALLVGLSVLLQLAEIGRLRVICASHSLLFAAGLARHPKVQVLDLGQQGSWLSTQEIVLRLAADEAKIASVGKDILSKMQGQAKDSRRKTSSPRGRKRSSDWD